MKIRHWLCNCECIWIIPASFSICAKCKTRQKFSSAALPPRYYKIFYPNRTYSYMFDKK